VAAIGRLTKKAVPAEAIAPTGQKIRFSAKGLRSHRGALGLSAADYGQLVGVTGHTIYKWEQGETHPRQAQLAALVPVRGLRKREATARLEQFRGKSATARKKKK
jgi:DNA-binding transcriptional regulator YiaG